MKRGGEFLVLLLLSCLATWAQQRPTLGENPSGPSLRGLRTFNTMDARRLRRVRTIFVEHIENSLSEKLAEGLAKMGRFRIVDKRRDADAVLRGTCSDLRRLKSVHSEVYLADSRADSTIWQDTVRRPYNPPPLDKVVGDTALLIVQHLTDSLRQADRAQ